MKQETPIDLFTNLKLNDPSISQIVQDSEQWLLLEGRFNERVKIFVRQVGEENKKAEIELRVDKNLLPANIDVQIGREITRDVGRYVIFAEIDDERSDEYGFAVVPAEKSAAFEAIRRRGLVQQRQREMWLGQRKR